MFSISGKKIFVTGGKGFVGEPFVRALRECGAEVLAPSRSECDVLNFEQVEQYVKQADAVVHLAAFVGGIGFNREHPGDMWYQNLQMGINILEAARKHQLAKVLICGTVCAFPKVPPHIPFIEEDIWMGYPEETNAPYGLAKKMLFEGARSYRKQYGLNAIYVTPTNMYGPRDNFNLESSHVLPALIRKIHTAVLEDRPEVLLWGTGVATREFLYVDDCIRGLLLALEKYESLESINIGSGAETSIKDLAELIGKLLNFKGRFVWDGTKPDGQPRRSFDISRARRELGYEPQVHLEEGVKRTIAWWLENYTTWHRV